MGAGLVCYAGAMKCLSIPGQLLLISAFIILTGIGCSVAGQIENSVAHQTARNTALAHQRALRRQHHLSTATASGESGCTDSRRDGAVAGSLQNGRARAADRFILSFAWLALMTTRAARLGTGHPSAHLSLLHILTEPDPSNNGNRS